MAETAERRYRRILSLDNKMSVACFMPWIGEFGWYIMTHVKRIHGFNAIKKIAFIKKGHEALFPTVDEFIYDWADISDDCKTGVVNNPNLNAILSSIKSDSTIVYHTDISWHEKTSLANIQFMPKHKIDHNLKVDVVMAPRKRKIDSPRNMKQETWQTIANVLVNRGISVGIVGSADTTHNIVGNVVRSSNYVDVDTDIELINNSKCTICQESGMLYLIAMCKKPTFVIDWCHREIYDLHRDHNVFFNMVSPTVVANKVTEFLARV